jgi:hypothetical protein
MKKRNGARLAAVLPADPQLYLRTNSSPFLNSHPYESTHPFGVNRLKGVVCKNTPIYVRGKEPPRIVAAKPQCSLCQVICSK